MPIVRTGMTGQHRYRRRRNRRHENLIRSGIHLLRKVQEREDTRRRHRDEQTIDQLIGLVIARPQNKRL